MSKSLTAKGATLPDVPEWKAPFYMGSLLLLCVLKKNAKGEGVQKKVVACSIKNRPPGGFPGGEAVILPKGLSL